MRERTEERKRFLADLLCTAIEHAGYGFPMAAEWVYSDDSPGDAYAVIRDRYDEDDRTWRRVTIDTMASGLGVIRSAFVATCDRGTHLHNRDTFECLYFGGEERADLLLSDRSNGEDGDYDVIGALAVLECALFGRVVYA